MATPFNMPVTNKPVDGITCTTTNGGSVTDIISLKDSNRCTIICKLKQAVGHATLLTPQQATDVAGTGAKVLANVVNIWANEATATTDTNVKQTSAVNYTVDAVISSKIVVFVIEPGDLDVENSFDCIKMVCADSSQATNFWDVTFVLDKRTRQTTPPSDITD